MNADIYTNSDLDTIRYVLLFCIGVTILGIAVILWQDRKESKADSTN